MIDTTCGVYLIGKDQVDAYLKIFNPMQLRNDKRVNVNECYSCMNFGEAKGTEHKRVLIYPTSSIWNWLKDPNNPKNKLKEKTKAAFYVAVTRAQNSVCIVRKDDSNIKLLKDYKIESEEKF